MTKTKNVLVIDDSEEIQYLLNMLLVADGCYVDCAANGEDAINFLNSCKVRPDLILLDLHMPVMDGAEFLECRSHIPALKRIPVVLISGDEGIVSTGSLNCVADVLKKPLNIASVVQTVRRHLSPSIFKFGESSEENLTFL